MARLYANENFPFPVVEELRKLGHDVLTIQETGKAGRAQSDEEIIAFALTESRIILTLNRVHFIHQHNKNLNHKGIVTCTFDPNFPSLAQRIHLALKN
jgi:predicted nuclease of predicted toxin-antitoxin system